MDGNPLDLEKLFEEAQHRSEAESEANAAEPGLDNVQIIQCKCGQIVNITIPAKCPGCGDNKSYWKTADRRVLKLSQMTIGHLTNSIKFLAEKAEKTPHSLREALEIALDLLYEELGSREQETKQLSGIQAALFRNI